VIERIIEPEDPSAADALAERYLSERLGIFIPTFIHKKATEDNTCKIYLNINMNRHAACWSFILKVPITMSTKELAEVVIDFASSRKFQSGKRNVNSSFRDFAKSSIYHVNMVTRKNNSRKQLKIDLLNFLESGINWTTYMEDDPDQNCKKCTISFDFIIEADSSLKIKS
jgi:hypothetical protein